MGNIRRKSKVTENLERYGLVSIIRELLTFAGARVLSFLVLELGRMYLMVWGCELITGLPISTPMTHFGSFAFTYDYLVKLINSIFIVIANYVMSKLMVFKKKDMVDYNAEDKKTAEASSGKEAADA